MSLTIRDQGPGIPEQDLNNIFNKFIQSTKTTEVHEQGTGLGLAICKEIINRHHGKIWAENHPEGGAIFTFIIPINQPDLIS